MTSAAESKAPSSKQRPVWRNWAEVLRTQNLSSEHTMDIVSRWLLITRASVFPMTITSGVLGGLLAVAGPTPATANWFFLALALFGLVLAHAANNMINDYLDLASGVDSAEYVRGQYAPHPILSGLVSKGGLVAAIAAVNLVDLAILVYLGAERGPLVYGFALAGLFISVFYVAPPLKLKHHGFGEPGVFLVWGPLMIAGTYFVTTGAAPAWVFAASLPYALLVTVVLFGKHIDKLEADAAKGIHTLPVLLGEAQARFVAQALMVSFFVVMGILVLTGTLGVWTLASFAALPRCIEVMRVFRTPKPAEPPPGYPLWPLWYVAWAFLLTRRAGVLFALGLVATAIYPVFL
ncbi:MAG: putative 1,4-Dihydroxy-2-naphtoate prenyltransferase [Deltaproteobacteria bacterium]|nr:putative 1,4-Dihydroxy-2-naphtoate prenyltransferase [Deltaproteobacteria bacterium]